MTLSTVYPTRESALDLFRKFNRSESLLKHALSVEGVMRYMARKAGEDEEKWAIIGLIHDLDYEIYPDQHCTMTKKILEENMWPEEYIRAVLSHGWGSRADRQQALRPLGRESFLLPACAGQPPDSD